MPQCLRGEQAGVATSAAARSTGSLAEILTARKNLKALIDLPGMWVNRVREHKAIEQIILDLDISVSETYGRQEGSG